MSCTVQIIVPVITQYSCRNGPELQLDKKPKSTYHHYRSSADSQHDGPASSSSPSSCVPAAVRALTTALQGLSPSSALPSCLRQCRPSSGGRRFDPCWARRGWEAVRPRILWPGCRHRRCRIALTPQLSMLSCRVP